MGAMTYTSLCHKSHVPLNSYAKCRGEQCHECNFCGWNPDVNRRRRQMIREKAAKNQLVLAH